ncbi:hypothetical protein [Nocardia sp. NPDC005366]|uniref:hypothetical protein n=1 Tax=Nocardia sp. NPDC005366 TaxID=3156878 RepID=UPI0033A92DFD
MPGLVEQVVASGAEVLVLSSTHADVVTSDRVMAFADVECLAPRASFARWSPVGGRRGAPMSAVYVGLALAFVVATIFWPSDYD